MHVHDVTFLHVFTNERGLPDTRMVTWWSNNKAALQKAVADAIAGSTDDSRVERPAFHYRNWHESYLLMYKEIV